jgi:TetR/AcrR family transcriptional regulator
VPSSQPTPSTARAAPDSGAERILAAAARLFAEAGYAGTSMQAVARAAGVSKSNVFHHFPGKEALFAEVIRLAMGEFRARLEGMLDDGGDLETRLHAFLSGHRQHIERREPVARLLLREAREADVENGRRLAREMFNPNFSLVLRLLERAREQGLIRPDADLALAALLMLNANIFHLETRNVLRHLEGVDFADDPQDFTRRLTALLVHGLAPCAPEADA